MLAEAGTPLQGARLRRDRRDGQAGEHGDFLGRLKPAVLAVAYAGDGSVIPLPEQMGLGYVNPNDGSFQTVLYSDKEPIKYVRCLFAGTDKLASAGTGLLPVLGPNDPPPADTPVPPRAPAASFYGPSEIPAPVKIDFDDLPDAAVIGNHYEAGLGMIFEDTSPPACSPTPTVPVRSRPRRCRSPTWRSTTPSSATSVNQPLRIQFTSRRSHVGMFMGNGEDQGLTGCFRPLTRRQRHLPVRNRPVPETYTEFIGLLRPQRTDRQRHAGLRPERAQRDHRRPVLCLQARPAGAATPADANLHADAHADPGGAHRRRALLSAGGGRHSWAAEAGSFHLRHRDHPGYPVFRHQQGLGGCADNSLPVVAKKDTDGAHLPARHQRLWAA